RRRPRRHGQCRRATRRGRPAPATGGPHGLLDPGPSQTIFVAGTVPDCSASQPTRGHTNPAEPRHRIRGMTMDQERGSWWRGALTGVLAGAAALGVGQFIAGFAGASSSPVVAVGQLQIDFTPPWLKNFAINEFGSHDKQVLVGGILVVLAIFAAVVGILAVRRLAYGMAGLAVFAVVGLTASASRPTATFTTMLPTLFAVATAVLVLRVLVPFAAEGRPADEGRRNFLIAGAATAGVALVADLIGRGL